jgi:hypothetical protein
VTRMHPAEHSGDNVGTVIDPELTIRIGALAPGDADRIDCYISMTMLWRRLGPAEASDVARGLHWHAVGRPMDPSAIEIIAALALVPPPFVDLEGLAARLRGQRPTGGSPDGRAPTLRNLRRLGARLSEALTLLDAVHRIVD